MREEAIADQRIARKLLSSNGTMHSILIALDPGKQLSLLRQQTLCDEIEGILCDHEIGRDGIHLAGLPVLNAAIGGEVQAAFLKLLPLGFVAVALLVFCIYHDLRVTVLSAAIGAIAVIWALGITSFVYGEITLLVAAAPLVILAVSTTDFLHITTALQLAYGDSEQDKEQVLTGVLEEVGGACVLTSMTSFIGFASLLLTHASAVRQLGFACAIGTSVALLLMVTLLPIAYRRMGPLSSRIAENPVYRACLLYTSDAADE